MIKSTCVSCGKEFEQEESMFKSTFCGNPDCFYELQCIEQWGILKNILTEVLGRKLLKFDLSSDGGKAILKFENKTVVLGAGGNLWDEAYPIFSNEVDKFPAWKPMRR